MSLSSLLQQLAEVEKAFVEADSLLAFGLFLLELVHFVHLVATTLEVDILSSGTRLFVELDINSRLVADQDWGFQVEVQNDNQFI